MHVTVLMVGQWMRPKIRKYVSILMNVMKMSTTVTCYTAFVSIPKAVSLASVTMDFKVLESKELDLKFLRSV